MMMGWYGGSGWGGWLVGGVMMLVFWGLLIFGGIAVWRAADQSGRGRQPVDQPAPHPPTPEQLLGERFARGEIGEDEYIKRRELLHAPR